MPVIAAATQARDEGYFRREWKLAVERTQDMADHLAFLLPVVLDDTKDRDAHVPEAFFKVQWTRLPGGEMPPAFVERVRALLGGGAGVARAFQPVGLENTGWKARATNETVGRRVPAAAWGVAGVAVALLVAGYFWSQRPTAPAPQAGAGTRPPAPEKSAPSALSPPTGLSPARVLVARARALYEPWDFAVQDDFKPAE